MGEPYLSLRAAWEALYLSRQMPMPDGSPLYSYRFQRAEYDGVGDLLRGRGVNALRSPHGAALTVMYLAEWFRRERHGGGWDWVTPLNLLGIRYHATEASADMRYPEVRAAMEDGLRLWRRPLQARGSPLLAVIRESGFPAADLANGRLGVWLRRSVLAADTGFGGADAVASEAWRAGETLVQALFESAVILCDAVVQLRRKLAEQGVNRGDSIVALDALEPDWRKRLPFDVEDDEFRRLVEGLVTARRMEAPALSVDRRYVRTEFGWRAHAQVLLEGVLDARRAPAGLLDALSPYARVRLCPRGDAARWTLPVATLEREDDEEGGLLWRARAMVPRHCPVLDPSQEVKLSAAAGETDLIEFVPFGGEALLGPVLALQFVDADGPGDVTELQLIGESPAATTRPWLALALTDDAAASLVVEGERHDFPSQEGAGRRMIAFSGKARLMVDGEMLVWKTGNDRESSERLVLTGPQLRRVREAVFLGAPKAWSHSDERTSSVRPGELLWKPVGQGRWQTVESLQPRGDVYFAVRRHGEMAAMTRARVLPAGFDLVVDRKARRIRISGAQGARIIALADTTPLVLETTVGSTAVPLGKLAPGGVVNLKITWENSVDLSLDDPFSEPLLLDADGRALPPRSALTLDRMGGMRLLAPQEHEIWFEGRAPRAAPIFTSRRVVGSVPLEAYDDVVDELLGSFEDVDAKVRLTWSGHGDWFAEIGRWEVDEPLWRPRLDSPFAVLSERTTVRREAFSLFAPAAGEIEEIGETRPNELADRLRHELAGGPWLLTGHRADGAVLRPTLLFDRSIDPFDRDLNESLHRVISAAEPTSGHEQAERTPPEEELRWLVDLCVRMKAVGAPYAAAGVLCDLARSPPAAPFVLAACETRDERFAVLDLQSSLPFLWCATDIGVWQVAFQGRLGTLRRHLAERDVEDSAKIAARMVARALGHVAEVQPVLATHARVCLAGVIDEICADDVPSVFRGPPVSAESSEIAQRLVARRPDDRIVILPGMADRIEDRSLVWSRFEAKFRDVVAAPLVAARIAAGRLKTDAGMRTACRSARTWDREYFDEAFAAAMMAEARTPHAAVLT